jgi:hypothetical protein
VDSSFTNVKYHFITNELDSILINKYESKTRIAFIISLYVIMTFQRRLCFEGIFSKIIHIGSCGSFGVWCLRENVITEITKKILLSVKIAFTLCWKIFMKIPTTDPNQSQTFWLILLYIKIIIPWTCIKL